MNHEEQKLQKQCVAWFRELYPQYAMLLTHPINEGYKGFGRIGGIHKAEGTTKGVPDLLFFMPSAENVYNDQGILIGVTIYHGLGIEFKTPKGKQSQEQKDFEKMFTAAQYKYVVIRSLDDFKKLMNEWIKMIHIEFRRRVAAAHVEIVQAAEQKEKEQFYKVIGKKGE